MIGDGNPKCKKCLGRGVTDVGDGAKAEPDKRFFTIPSVQSCECVMIRDISSNVEKGWKGLLSANKVSESPLLELTESSVWITAPRDVFRAHLRHVAVRQGPYWRFSVKSDMDLMTAWLGNIALKRQDIFDADVAREAATESLKFHSLIDLVIPPELLILQLGVKASRNVSMPELLEETITSRASKGKVTWVWDQPNQPLTHGHLCYSGSVHETLNEFERVRLSSDSTQSHSSEKRKSKTSAAPKSRPNFGGGLSLSGATNSNTGGVNSVEIAPKKTLTKAAKKY